MVPAWPMAAGPNGLGDQPLTWRQALLQQNSTAGSTGARLLQMPLVYALNFMGLRGQSEYRFTMCPKAEEARCPPCQSHAVPDCDSTLIVAPFAASI